MASKISVASVRGSIKELLDESSGEKKRNFIETVSIPSLFFSLLPFSPMIYYFSTEEV